MPEAMLAPKVSVSLEQKPPLDEGEIDVLNQASLGRTVSDAAQELDLSEEEVRDKRDAIKEKWQSRNMAEAVNRGILSGYVKFEYDEESTWLSRFEVVMLRSFAAGRHNGDIARALGRKNEADISRRARRLFKKIGADGKVHSVRRAHEMGVYLDLTPPSNPS
jgi:DNA-binding NarL/FixJ family response regulator